MKLNILLFGLFLLIFNYLYAQNYQAIKADAEYYFANGNNNINAIRIDSIASIGNDTIYYNFYTIREKIDTPECFTPYGASWIGEKVVIQPDGMNLFFNYQNDTIRINTLANLNDNWVFYKFQNNDYIEATITEIDTSVFLGIIDSTKTITLQVKDSNGNSISHFLNGKTLKLSKNYGLIKLFNFYELPFDYSGYTFEGYSEYNIIGKTNPIIGITNNVEAKNFFDFNIGDEFHTKEVHKEFYNFYSFTELIIKIVLNKYVSSDGDTITYIYKRCGNKTVISSNNDTTVVFYNDTISEIVNLSAYKILNYMPNKSYCIDSIYLEYYCAPMSVSYNHRIKKCIGDSYSYFDYTGNASCLSQPCYDPPFDDYYIEGCGGPYFSANGITGYSLRHLLYYKKNDEIWGSPLNCNELLGMEEVQDKTLQINISPNPMSNWAILTIEHTKNFPYKFQLYNAIGAKVREYQINSPSQIIYKKNLTNGLYFYLLSDIKGNTFSGKFVIE